MVFKHAYNTVLQVFVKIFHWQNMLCAYTVSYTLDVDHDVWTWCCSNTNYNISDLMVVQGPNK